MIIIPSEPLGEFSGDSELNRGVEGESTLTEEDLSSSSTMLVVEFDAIIVVVIVFGDPPGKVDGYSYNFEFLLFLFLSLAIFLLLRIDILRLRMNIFSVFKKYTVPKRRERKKSNVDTTMRFTGTTIRAAHSAVKTFSQKEVNS